MNVIVYSTKTCPYCHKLKDFLEANNIKFTDIDISSDHKAVNELMEKSGQLGVPVTDIDGEILIGFDESVLREKLKIG